MSPKEQFPLLQEPSEKKTPAAKQTQKPRLVAKQSRKKNKKTGKRIALCVATAVVFLLITVAGVCLVLLRGPSETMRDALVLSAKQASATKWLPGLFLGNDVIQQIEQNSKTVTYDVRSMDEYTAPSSQDGSGEDEWADAIDGIRLITLNKPAFKAYLLMVRDPSRVFVGISSDFKGSQYGAKIFDIVEKYNAVAAINGGEFPDAGGVGSGATPIGITFSQGKMVYSGHTNRTFMGFTNDNRLWVSEGMTEAKAKELGIRDGVCFQTGNSLITNDGSQMVMHYSGGNTGRSQRTAIGQRNDGTVLFLVTDGRTASSIGATHDELIDIMLEYGAVAAGMLDGGSSTMLFYRNYFDLYHIDTAGLDEYQRRGLVNTYKAFTEPRRLPTYFLVGESK